MEIQELSKNNFLTGCTVKVGELPGELMQNIVDLLKSRNSSDELLEQSIKRLQGYYGVSKELIRYCLLTDKTNHIEAIELMYTNYGKHKVRKEMRKFNKFIKSRNIQIDEKNGYYKRLLHWSGNLKKFTVARTIHLLSN
jgi:hypothetical protein